MLFTLDCVSTVVLVLYILAWGRGSRAEHYIDIPVTISPVNEVLIHTANPVRKQDGCPVLTVKDFVKTSLS